MLTSGVPIARSIISLMFMRSVDSAGSVIIKNKKHCFKRYIIFYLSNY